MAKTNSIINKEDNNPAMQGSSWQTIGMNPTPTPTTTKTPTQTQTSNYTPKTTSVSKNQITAPASDVYLKAKAYLDGLNNTNSEPIIKSAFEPEYQDDPYSDIGNYYKDQMSQEINPQDIYNQKLNQWQGYMDSLKSVYANKALEVDKQITGQLGTNRATQARSGLIGSTFGGAQNTKVENAGLEQKRLLADEMDAKIRFLMGEIDRDVSAEIAAKRQAIAQGTEAYTKFLADGQQRKLDQVNRISMSAMQQGVESIDELGADTLKEMSQKLGMTTSDIKYYFNTLKKQQEVAAAEAEREGQFNLSEGQSRYNSDGSLIASKGKTYAPSSGSSSSTTYSGTGGTSRLSSQAQNIIDLINKSGGSIDDYVKGTSNAAQSLRNEVFQGLSAQGGVTAKSTDLYQEAKNVIDDMIDNTDWKKFGMSANFGGKLLPSYGDMMTRAATVNAILTRDNLGLLKGAMSDKDIAFLSAMSNGVPEGTISESYAKQRMEDIQRKLESKISLYKPQGNETTTSTTVQTPQEMVLNGKTYQIGSDGNYYPVN